LTFVGAICVEFALAFAACSAGALCPVDCDWPPADCGSLVANLMAVEKLDPARSRRHVEKGRNAVGRTVR
jgi:hypothetical protein